MAPSITAMTRPSAMVRMAQLRCGLGRPSACSMMADGMWWTRSRFRDRLATAIPVRPLRAIATGRAGSGHADRLRVGHDPARRGEWRRRLSSAFAEEFVDAALQLPLLHFA